MLQRLLWGGIILTLLALTMSGCAETTADIPPTSPLAQVTPTAPTTPTKTTPPPGAYNQPEIKLAAIDGNEIPCCPRWSPDGQKIAFAIGLGNYKGIYVVNRDGRNFKRLVYIRRAEGDSPPIMPTWADDGQHILYREKDNVFIVAVDGSSDPQPYAGTDPPIPEPAWPADYHPPSPDTRYNRQLSPDEQYLAIVKGVKVPRSEQGLYIRPTHALSSTQKAPSTAEGVLNTQTYTDPMLNFSLRYPSAWTLEVRAGTNRNDGSGRTILLEREGYLLEMEAQFRPDIPGECSGRFHQDNDSPDDYWHYEADGVASWRPRVEKGHAGGYNDDTLTFVTIISPTHLTDTVDSKGYLGSYTCSLEIEAKIFAIDYRLPLSLDAIEAGQHRADIVAEMDGILQSIIWDVGGGNMLPTATPTPLTPVPPTPDSSARSRP